MQVQGISRLEFFNLKNKQRQENMDYLLTV